MVHHKFPVFIDEIQRAPNLFLQIKAKVDEMKSYGQVWASGSQKFALMKGVADSLAGRICPLDLMPLSIYERVGKGLEQKPYIPSEEPSKILETGAKEELWKTIWQGAWPRVIDMTPRQRGFFYNGLVQTYLERDVRMEAGVEKLAEYRNFCGNWHFVRVKNYELVISPKQSGLWIGRSKVGCPWQRIPG